MSLWGGYIRGVMCPMCEKLKTRSEQGKNLIAWSTNNVIELLLRTRQETGCDTISGRESRKRYILRRGAKPDNRTHQQPVEPLRVSVVTPSKMSSDYSSSNEIIVVTFVLV